MTRQIRFWQTFDRGKVRVFLFTSIISLGEWQEVQRERHLFLEDFRATEEKSLESANCLTVKLKLVPCFHFSEGVFYALRS